MNRIQKNNGAVKKRIDSAARREQASAVIHFAAASKIPAVLKKFNTTLGGLTEKDVTASRSAYGNNKVTHEKKKTLPRRLAEAFINPFTAILFCLAFVSAITDIILPLIQNSPDDFSLKTVVIILTMVLISGTLRFFQESRSGSAAEKLLGMITTTCTVDREGWTRPSSGTSSTFPPAT